MQHFRLQCRSGPLGLWFTTCLTGTLYQVAPPQLPCFLAHFLVGLCQVVVLPLLLASLDEGSDKAGCKDGRQERKPGHIYPLLNTEPRCFSMESAETCCTCSITSQHQLQSMNQCDSCMACLAKDSTRSGPEICLHC